MSGFRPTPTGATVAAGPTDDDAVSGLSRLSSLIGLIGLIGRPVKGNTKTIVKILDFGVKFLYICGTIPEHTWLII